MRWFAFMMYPFLLLLVIRFAPFEGKGLWEFIEYMSAEMENPLHFRWSSHIPKAVFIFTIIYVVVVFIAISSMKNTRYGEEHGSAKWEDAKAMGRRLRTKRPIAEYVRKETKEEKIERGRNDLIFTQNVRVALDSRECQNINTIIIGGAGRWKSRGFIIPNIMQMNSNYICTDPKGEIARKVGGLLKENGYDVRVLDLIEHFRSHGYNPFPYFRSDDDILLFVNNMWGAMEDKTATKGEQIWDDQAKNMMMSLCFYVYHYAPEEEQNLSTVMLLFNNINDAEDKKGQDPVDRLFVNIPHDDTAYTYYKAWSSASGRTLASIKATFSSRMSVFNLPSMKALTYRDEMNLLDLATKKVAIFMVIPDNNSVYNFMAGTLYTQMFQQLYDYSDHVIHAPLQRHVRFLMDEFANIALPNDYQKILSTSRSRNVSFVIVLQDKQQIEAIFEKYYRTIMANCEWQLFLGSLELETCKYFSELLGKETVIGKTRSKNFGRQGGSTVSEQLIERPLMTPNEVRGLKKAECVMITPFHGTVMDRKYNLKKHPFYHLINDRRGDKPYLWGESPLSVGNVNLLDTDYTGAVANLPKPSGVLMDEDELDAIAS